MNENFSDELISAYLDGEMTAEEQAAVERELRENPEARRMFDELRLLRSNLQSLPRHKLDEAFAERVLRRAELALPVPPSNGISNSPPNTAAAMSKQSGGQSLASRPGQDTAQAELRRWRRLFWAAASLAAALLFALVMPERFPNRHVVINHPVDHQSPIAGANQKMAEVESVNLSADPAPQSLPLAAAALKDSAKSTADSQPTNHPAAAAPAPPAGLAIENSATKNSAADSPLPAADAKAAPEQQQSAQGKPQAASAPARAAAPPAPPTAPAVPPSAFGGMPESAKGANVAGKSGKEADGPGQSANVKPGLAKRSADADRDSKLADAPTGGVGGGGGLSGSGRSDNETDKQLRSAGRAVKAADKAADSVPTNSVPANAAVGNAAPIDASQQLQFKKREQAVAEASESPEQLRRLAEGEVVVVRMKVTGENAERQQQLVRSWLAKNDIGLFDERGAKPSTDRRRALQSNAEEKSAVTAEKATSQNVARGTPKEKRDPDKSDKSDSDKSANGKPWGEKHEAGELAAAQLKQKVDAVKSAANNSRSAYPVEVLYVEAPSEHVVAMLANNQPMEGIQLGVVTSDVSNANYRGSNRVALDQIESVLNEKVARSKEDLSKTQSTSAADQRIEASKKKGEDKPIGNESGGAVVSPPLATARKATDSHDEIAGAQRNRGVAVRLNFPDVNVSGEVPQKAVLAATENEVDGKNERANGDGNALKSQITNGTLPAKLESRADGTKDGGKSLPAAKPIEKIADKPAEKSADKFDEKLAEQLNERRKQSVEPNPTAADANGAGVKPPGNAPVLTGAAPHPDAAPAANVPVVQDRVRVLLVIEFVETPAVRVEPAEKE